MKALVAATALLAVLSAASTADARLDRYTAYSAAQKDAEDVASERGLSASPNVPFCRRISRGRVDCRVSISGSHYVIGDPSYYEHEECQWTVIAKGLRYYPYVITSRREFHCRSWTSESPLGGR